MLDLLRLLRRLSPKDAAGQSTRAHLSVCKTCSCHAVAQPSPKYPKSPFVFNPISSSPDATRQSPAAHDMVSLAQVRDKMAICCVN